VTGAEAHDPSIYEAVVEAAREDPEVVGLILTGSRGKGIYVRPDTDWDIRLIAHDESFDAAEARHGTPHGSPVEVAVMRLSRFVGACEIGSSSEWDRYSFVHVPVVVDKLDGRIAELVAAKAVLSPEEARQVVERDVGDYINTYYRVLKNARSGLETEAHLDAVESIGPLLSALFALSERVRPFNRYLRWELEEFPLPDPRLAADVLLPRLRGIVRSGDVAEQAALFRDVEGLVRARGYGAAVDDWDHDVPWFRAGQAFPAS
jgi:hypothetical protein